MNLSIWISIILDIYIMIQFYFRLAEHFGRNRFAMIFLNMFIIPSIVLGDEEYIGWLHQPFYLHENII